ncbi:hypothetical protein BDZ89DRAFT_1083813 [Hymenopellis radicata]|nr:hypothetical protein BDZ89DRAFT_1083813 [Hymenopellis radicata]
MPVQDICAADCSQDGDVAADGGYDAPIEDEESDWKRRWPYILDEDVEEDCSDEDDPGATGSDEDIEIVQLVDSGDCSCWAWEWKPIGSSDVKDLLGTSMGLDNLKGWIPETWMLWLYSLRP